jgi:hypothetical protein
MNQEATFFGNGSFRNAFNGLRRLEWHEQRWVLKKRNGKGLRRSIKG